MSTDTQKPVAWMTHHDEPMLFPTEREAQSYCDDDEHPIPLYVDPVAAQPDITQQTLDDVKAGIPARDAEIEALRKQVETLQAQLVDRSPEMQGTLVDESPKLQSQKQPVSGADGLPPMPEGNCATEVGGSSHNPPIYFESDMIEYARAALAQQDADKVDAERYQAWRDALITGKTAEDDFIRLVADNLPTSVGVSRRPTAAEWDAAIDAARKEGGNG